jgi:hypothetical protein
VNGVPADSLVVNSSSQVTFTFVTSPVSTQGVQTMSMSEGAVLRASDGDGLAAFSGNFRFDAVPLQVTSTVPPALTGGFTLPGPFTYDVNFNEPVNPASVQTWDLVLGGITGAFVSGVTVLTGDTTARFTLSGISAQGTLTAVMMAGGITDAFGNPSSAFSGTYFVDLDTAPYPAPLAAKNPSGSLIYSDPTVSGFVNFAGDVDSFTLNVDPNQTISLILTPAFGGLQPRIELFDPNNVLQALASAPAPGQVTGIQTSAANLSGVYRFAVSGVGTTTGGYTLQVILNSAFELEGKFPGSTNDTPFTTVQTLNAVDSGFYARGGEHTASSNGYPVGQLSLPSGQVVTEFRNYTTFALPAATPIISGAELRLFTFSYSSPDPTETYTLFDVSATPAELDTDRTGSLAGMAIYNDLGSGTVYGTRAIAPANVGTTVAIPLNAAAVAALNAAIGSTISFGGALTTLAGTAASQMVFGSSQPAPGQVQLVLQTTAPVVTAQNIDNSLIAVETPQASAQRGALLGQTDLSTSYTAAAVPFTFEDISATGTIITPMTNQDNTVVLIPVGFAFPFYGLSNTSVLVSSNGVLTFGGGTNSGINTDLITTPGNATIAPFWDDLHTAGGVPGSNVFFQTLGSGADQHLTVQWNNIRFFTGGTTGDTITFQAQLFADGRIQFNYTDLVSGTAPGNNGASATVGIKPVGTLQPNRMLLAFNNGPNAFVGSSQSTLFTLSDPTPDYYAFTLGSGETATLAATGLASGNLTLELRDSTDAVLATGVGSNNLTSVINDFTAAATGTYYARIRGGSGTTSLPYSLVVTRNAAFDTEDNSSASAAQPWTGTQAALGAIFSMDTLNAADSGWIATNGTHTTANNNYAVGRAFFGSDPLSEFRNYFTFNLPAGAGTILGAELRLFNPPSAFVSPDPTETYTLFDVFATPAALDANRTAGDPAGMAIHGDLGSGTVYGSTELSTADNNTTVVIPLNAAAVAALNAAIGSTISLGGAITTLEGTAQQSAFGFTSGTPGQVQLVLQTVLDDWYSITVPITANALRLETSTPGDGSGEPVNTLNPRIDLYDSTGATLLASGVAMADGRNESLVATGLAPGATYKARVSSDSETRGEYFLTRNFNFSPVVTDVTAPPINENDTATVNGAFTDLDSGDTHTVVITWGPDEGSTTLTLAAGESTFSATHQYLDDNPTGTLSDVYSISVTVTDNHFGAGEGSVDLTVHNVAPAAGPISGPSSGVRGQSLDFSGSFADAGSLDTHEVRWDFGDGAVIDFHSTTDPNALAATHVYTASGVYTLTLSIRDDDGGVTSVSQAITITAVAIQADPHDPARTALVVGGTTGNDSIVFAPRLGAPGDILVSIDGVSQGIFQPTGHLIAYGQEGNDGIFVLGSIALDAWLYGGAGNDLLKGALGTALLLGGDGNDILYGGRGRSVLIGGHGNDLLYGASGDDILIGGLTAFDGDALGLCAILDEWKSADPYAVRVSRLRLVLDASTVIDDGELDILAGASGQDWFFVGVGDYVTRIQDDESVG